MEDNQTRAWAEVTAPKVLTEAALAGKFARPKGDPPFGLMRCPFFAGRTAGHVSR